MAVARCVYCSQPVRASDLSADGGAVKCVTCGRRSVIVPMPALVRDSAPKPPPFADPPGEGEAACYYSPGRRATKSCSHCGVLICDIWSAQWGADTVCLKCLEHLKDKAKDRRFQTKITQWDNIALGLALVPATIAFWFMAFVTAPAAVFVALWHWNSPRSIMPRSRVRLVIALLLGLLQVGGGVAFFTGAWFGWFK